MRLKMFEGPIKRQLEDTAEYKKPISLDQIQELYSAGTKDLRKQDPGLAAVVKDAVVQNLIMAMRENNGVFTLEALERTNDALNIAQSGIGRLMSDGKTQDRAQVAQIGTALLAKLLIDWVNKGRPDPAPERGLPLDLGKVRGAVVEQGVKEEDQRYIETFLKAWEAANPGKPITIREIENFQEQIKAAQEPLDKKIQGREDAKLPRDQALSDQRHQLTLQSLGAYRLTDLVGYFADQGELAKLAADVKPGAGQMLAGAM